MARILLIEPDKLLAETFKGRLEKAGYAVHVAHSAQQAVDRADNNKPDVIILELQLSNHNGVEFLYELRSYPEWQHIPVIILSNVPPNEIGTDSKTMQQLGIVNYLYKPRTTLAQLVAGIEVVIPAS